MIQKKSNRRLLHGWGSRLTSSMIQIVLQLPFIRGKLTVDRISRYVESRKSNAHVSWGFVIRFSSKWILHTHFVPCIYGTFSSLGNYIVGAKPTQLDFNDLPCGILEHISGYNTFIQICAESRQRSVCWAQYAGTTLAIYLSCHRRSYAARQHTRYARIVCTHTTAEHERAYLMRSICNASPKTKCRTIKTQCVFIPGTKCQRSGEQRYRGWDIGERTSWW